MVKEDKVVKDGYVWVIQWEDGTWEIYSMCGQERP